MSLKNIGIYTLVGASGLAICTVLGIASGEVPYEAVTDGANFGVGISFGCAIGKSLADILDK